MINERPERRQQGGTQAIEGTKGQQGKLGIGLRPLVVRKQ